MTEIGMGSAPLGQRDPMSILSGLRKFKPGGIAHVRHAWRAYVTIALLGALGLALLLMLRSSG